MQPAIEPTEVRISDAAHTVTISWEGHVSTYPWWYLRGFCPCAVCQGHGSQTHFVGQEAPELTSINEVGNYALNVVWGAHNTGIYTFPFLRRLCPCADCQDAEGAGHLATLVPQELRATLAQAQRT